MTSTSRFEKWIAPRALPLLAIIGVLVIGGGVLAYFIREGDLNRVERLERVILCQHNNECREFVERAIREILRKQRVKPREQGTEEHQGVTFRLGPKKADAPPPLVVEVPDNEGGHSPGQKEAPESSDPHEKPPSGAPDQGHSPGLPDLPENEVSPINPGKNDKVAPETPQPKAMPTPVGEADSPAQGPISSAGQVADEVLEGVGQGVKELPCSALREVHGLC
jgi:hypothetical protein